MKHLITLLSLLLCHLITAQVTLSPQQAKEVYKGLKQGEILKTRLQAVDSLNNIILEQDYGLNLLTDSIRSYNTRLTDLYNERQRAAVEAKKIPWYKHPILWGVLGFISGILIAK